MFRVRYLLCVQIVFLLLINGDVIEIPTPIITAYEPHGIKITLPNIDGMNEFFFWGNINEELESTDLGTIRLETFEPTDGKWTIEDHSVSLQKGDVIYYVLFVKISGRIHRLGNMSYQIQGNYLYSFIIIY